MGSRRFDRAETAIGNTITLFMGVSVVLAAILFALCPQVVALIGTPPEAVEGTAAYLRICFVGIPFIAAYNILSAIFRGLGDSRSPMYVIGVACIINIALDFLFIGHMGLGPVGAALGTVTAQTASVALALVWLKSRRTNIHVKRSDLRPQPEVLGSILKIGVPVAVQDGCIQMAFMFITVIANHRARRRRRRGPGREDDQLFVHCAEFHGRHRQCAHGTKRRCGQGRPRASGAQGRHDDLGGVRLPDHGADVASSADVYWLFCQGPRGGRGRYRYMHSYIFDAIFAGIHICFSGFFAAYGKSYIGFAHNVLAVALIRVPGAWLLSNAYSDTLFPMGIASPCGSILSAVICVVAFTVLNRRGAFDKLVA